MAGAVRGSRVVAGIYEIRWSPDARRCCTTAHRRRADGMSWYLRLAARNRDFLGRRPEFIREGRLDDRWRAKRARLRDLYRERVLDERAATRSRLSLTDVAGAAWDISPDGRFSQLRSP